MIKQLGNTQIKPKHLLRCHCGAVVIQVDLPNGMTQPYRCNCSLCRRKGAIMSAVPLDALRIRQGEVALRLYQFNTNTAHHYFCSVCGIYTHHRRRSDPNTYGYNVACLDGVNPFDLGEVPTSDGINHIRDR